MSADGLRPRYTFSQREVRLSAGCPVRFAFHSVPGAVAPHDHEFYELCVVLGGTADHITELGRVRVGRGDVLVIPKGAVHAFDRPRGLRVVNGYYLADWLLGELAVYSKEESVVEYFLAAHLFRARTFLQPRMFRLESNALERCLLDVEDLVAEASADVPSLLFLRSTLLKLMFQLKRGLSGQVVPGSFASLRPEVIKVLEEIENRVPAGRPCRAGDLAAAAGISAHHVNRLFKHATGWTPLEYFQRRRVQLAGALLLDRSRSISDVAHELGFSDGPHFTRTFKAISGRTPKEYRKVFFAGESPATGD